MTKKLHLITAALIAGTMGQLHAQHYQLNVSDVQKEKSWPYKIIGKDQEGHMLMSGVKNAGVNANLFGVFLALGPVKSHKFIRKYDADLNQIAHMQVVNNTEELRQSWIKRSVEVDDMVIDGKCYQVVWGRQNKRITYYLAEVNNTSGTVDHAVRLMELPAGSKPARLKFIHKYSPDGNYIMFLAASRKKGKKNSTYTAAVCRRDLKEQWHTTYTLPSASSAFSYSEASPGNAGQIIIAGRAKGSKGNPGYASVYYMDEKNKRPKELRLKFGKDYVDNVYVTYNAANEPMLVGFYKNEPRKKGYDGVLYANLQTDGTVINIRKKEFTGEFVTSVYTDKEKKKAARKEKRKGDVAEEKSFGFTEFYATEDGGYVGIAESYYMDHRVEVSTTNSGMAGGMMQTKQTHYYTHHYEDLIVFKFDAAGEITAMNKIAKKSRYVSQALTDRPYEKDYASVNMGNYTYLLFNDDEDLEANQHHKRDKTQGIETTYIVRVANDGSLKRDVLIERRQIGAFGLDVHRDLYKMADNKFAFIAAPRWRLGKKLKLGQVAITE